MEHNNALMIFLIASGIFCLASAIANWNWFMEHRKARVVVKILGRTGARVLYSIVGLFLFGFGILMATGFLPGA